MTNEPKLEVSTDAFGHVTYSITHEGVLLTKEQAESVAERIKALEKLCADMDVCIFHGAGWDCDRCPRNDKHECDFERRMDELGIPRSQ